MILQPYSGKCKCSLMVNKTVTVRIYGLEFMKESIYIMYTCLSHDPRLWRQMNTYVCLYFLIIYQ